MPITFLRIKTGEKMDDIFQEDEQSLHLTDYLNLISKHRLLIISILVIIVLATMLYVFTQPKIYKATSTLLIDKEQTQSPLGGDLMNYDSYLSESLSFNTHFKLIKSRKVLELVIYKLRLEQAHNQKSESAKGMFANIVASIKKNILLIFKGDEKTSELIDPVLPLVKELKDMISIKEIRDTRLLELSVENVDPRLAMEIANAVSQAYIKFNITNRLKHSQNTITWMTGQLYEVQKKLEDAEKAFQVYKEDKKIFSIEGKQSIISQKMEEINDAYIKARNMRMEIEAKLGALESIPKKDIDILKYRALTDNKLIEDLYKKLLELDVEYSRLQNVFKSKHPRIIEVRTNIRDIKNKFLEELKKESEALKSKGTVLKAREQAMLLTINELETEAMDINKKEFTYSILKRNVDTNKKLYDVLLSKLEESNITNEIIPSNIRVVEDAILPKYPIKPNKKRALILSILIGLMAGAGASFLWEYLDRSLRTEEDIQRYLDLPTLAVVPVAGDEMSGKTKG